MTLNNSPRVNSCLTQESASNSCKEGMQSANVESPVISSSKSTNLQPLETVQSKYLQNEGSLSLQNSLIPSCESSSPPPITTNEQASEVDSTPINKEIDKKSSQWQYLPVILKFLGEQLTSPLPFIFSGVLGLVVIAMLIGQASGGIKLKLDLEVSSPPNESKKAATTK